MTRPLRGTISLTLAALACLAAACSAGPGGGPTVEATSQSISCTSAGIHVEGCGLPSPPVRPPIGEVCAEDTTCTAVATGNDGELVDGFPEPIFAGNKDRCTGDSGFDAQLAAMGCEPALFYTPGGELGHGFYISWCPHAPQDTEAVWTVIDSCNTCTGPRPEAGWVLVAWTDGLCIPTTFPGGGCNTTGCLILKG